MHLCGRKVKGLNIRRGVKDRDVSMGKLVLNFLKSAWDGAAMPEEVKACAALKYWPSEINLCALLAFNFS